jgi:acetylornithine deacetylase/succinyl-diaminopimelate desuccinylase-like protein
VSDRQENRVALTDDLPADETRELLQTLIRNRCVNDGSPTSGDEHRNASVLEAYLLGRGVELQRYEPVPGRVSLVARIRGTDPDAPTIGLMGHTDVVPVTPERWRHDPFGGELIDGIVWGRGAIDMLNLTASMAVAVRRLSEGPRPKASVVFLAVADEEGGGERGAGWLVDNAWDDIACDVVLTESGGMLTQTPAGPRIAISNAEKGVAWRDLVIRGTSSHGSRPYRSDNAIVTAAEVVRRLSSHRDGARIGAEWEAWVRMQGLPASQEAALLDPARALDAIDEWGDPGNRALMHAMTHTTFSPNVIHGGTKTNVIPDEVRIRVDIRTLPGATDEDVDAELAAILTGLEDVVSWHPSIESRPATTSSTDNRWWALLADLAIEAHPEARAVPRMVAGGTDAAYFRQRGVPSYGAGLFSSRIDLASFSAMFHGPDERVDVASLGLSAAYWREFVQRAT